MAASDLTLEPGIRYGAEGGGLAQDPDADYVMGILTLRMDSYREALALARACPHLKYGGSVTVRRAGSGFFKVTEGFDFVR